MQQQLWPPPPLHLAAVSGSPRGPSDHSPRWRPGCPSRLGWTHASGSTRVCCLLSFSYRAHTTRSFIEFSVVFAAGGLPHLRGGTPWLLRTSVLHAAGGSSVWPVPGRGGLRSGLRHVLFHGQPGRMCGISAACAGLEPWLTLCLPGRSGGVPVFPPHPYLRLQRAHHHEGVWGTLICQQWLGRVWIFIGDWGRSDRGWPLRRATLLLLPAEVQTEAAEVWPPAVFTENMLVHDSSNLQELLPRAASDEAAVCGPALQLDGRHVFHALLHRLCGGRPVRGRAQCITRKYVQAAIRRRSDFFFVQVTVVCVCVCVQVAQCVSLHCKEDYAKTTDFITTWWKDGQRKNPFHFGVDPNEGADPGISSLLLSHRVLLDVFTDFPGNNSWILMTKIRHIQKSDNNECVQFGAGWFEFKGSVGPRGRNTLWVTF